MAKIDYERSLHGVMPGGIISGAGVESSASGQPAIGSDPTQGLGTPAWQQALQMGLQVNARQRRN